MKLPIHIIYPFSHWINVFLLLIFNKSIYQSYLVKCCKYFPTAVCHLLSYFVFIFYVVKSFHRFLLYGLCLHIMLQNSFKHMKCSTSFLGENHKLYLPLEQFYLIYGKKLKKKKTSNPLFEDTVKEGATSVISNGSVNWYNPYGK